MDLFDLSFTISTVGNHTYRFDDPTAPLPINESTLQTWRTDGTGLDLAILKYGRQVTSKAKLLVVQAKPRAGPPDRGGAPNQATQDQLVDQPLPLGGLEALCCQLLHPLCRQFPHRLLGVHGGQHRNRVDHGLRVLHSDLLVHLGRLGRSPGLPGVLGLFGLLGLESASRFFGLLLGQELGRLFVERVCGAVVYNGEHCAGSIVGDFGDVAGNAQKGVLGKLDRAVLKAPRTLVESVTISHSAGHREKWTWQSASARQNDK